MLSHFRLQTGDNVWKATLLFGEGPGVVITFNEQNRGIREHESD